MNFKEFIDATYLTPFEHRWICICLNVTFEDIDHVMGQHEEEIERFLRSNKPLKLLFTFLEHASEGHISSDSIEASTYHDFEELREDASEYLSELWEDPDPDLEESLRGFVDHCTALMVAALHLTEQEDFEDLSFRLLDLIYAQDFED